MRLVDSPWTTGNVRFCSVNCVDHGCKSLAATGTYSLFTEFCQIMSLNFLPFTALIGSRCPGWHGFGPCHHLRRESHRLQGALPFPFDVSRLVSDAKQRKPIYDNFDLPATNPAHSSPKAQPIPIESAPSTQPEDEEEHKQRGPAPTDRLAVQIGAARLELYKLAVAAEDRVNETMDKVFNLEQSFTNTIASLAPSPQSGERIMPGAIYVLVAAMAGSIVSRNRNILLRASMPLALGVGAGWYLLPNTMTNISDLAWTYEKRFPAIAESHVKLRESIEQGISFARAHKDVGKRYVEDKVTDARETVEGWVKAGK